MRNTTQDLFELLERVQSARIDDQRCVLPPYFSQVSPPEAFEFRVVSTEKDTFCLIG
ncbi:UNVERIFIED_CONTAM: hypothetical protein PYX00_003425 [Menopon gallinae]|uniref:Uncharacterized protein n=1 Tax=Menopon gallinae TaxID=328185 RepID=A0AAW2I0B7_9NEOP